MAAKTYKVKFESQITESFNDFGLTYHKDKDGQIVTVEQIPPFQIKRGETKDIDQATYDYLKGKGAILSKAEKKEQDRLRKKYLRKRSGRAEPKKEMQRIAGAEKNVIFNDIPFEV
jgi:uncharacterized protein YnzC (UPF0291/DUF896 family)